MELDCLGLNLGSVTASCMTLEKLPNQSVLVFPLLHEGNQQYLLHRTAEGLKDKILFILSTQPGTHSVLKNLAAVAAAL